jgi:L-ribulose-5-phosphate 3-epimerase
MKYIGHTMGTPELNLRGAMRLFKDLGYDGIEVRCAKDGQIDTTCADDEFLALARKWSRDYSLPVTCLTPYCKDFVTAARETEIARMKRAIQIASVLDCPNVRVYGGMDPNGKAYSSQDNWEKTASGIRELAAYAKRLGVRLCIETHIGSLTMSAADTVKMVRLVDMENVGILFDFAWVFFAGKESVQEGVRLCAPHIFHCHFKDFSVWEEAGGRQKRSALMGKGNLPWTEVIRELVAQGYQGTLADEYERYWYPEFLPEPDIGMKSNLAYMRGLVEKAGG